MADIFSIADQRYFASYDASEKLQFHKLTFNFQRYVLAFGLEGLSKVAVFDDFLTRNETDWNQPLSVKLELQTFFDPMTAKVSNYHNKHGAAFSINYQNMQDPEGYISVSELAENQWSMVDYGFFQTRRLQDYFFTDQDKVYTKYNFDFSTYSNDFNSHGNKLVLFTECLFRIQLNNGQPPGFYGSGPALEYSKYFYVVEDLSTYMSKYGNTSVWKNVSKNNLLNIDYDHYAELQKLQGQSECYLQEHYIRYGQFERLSLNYIRHALTSMEQKLESVCGVYASSNGTGFLYKNKSYDSNIYVVTCAHLVDVTNLNTFKARFTRYDPELDLTVSTLAEFKIAGRDIPTDILVGIFDATLPFNVSNQIDLSKYKVLQIDSTHKNNISDSVYSVGAVGMIDQNSFLSGTIMDSKYVGSFGDNSTEIPPSLLIDMNIVGGMSGAPVFNSNNDEKVIGMLVGQLGGNDSDKYSIALTSFYLDNIVNNIIGGYAYYSVLYKDDPVKLMYFTKNGVTKKTLGGILEYFHPSASKKMYNSLSNFHYVGGILLTDVVLGFDYDMKKYITDPDSLSEQSVIKLDTPLLNTQLYQRFLDSGKEPIVLKTMAFYDGFTGEYQKFQLGKFGNQVGMHRFGYGLTTTGVFPTSNMGDDYYNSVVAYRPSVVVEYCYYDGNNWIEETETIGGNDENWYTSYTDTLGNKILQHKFDFPSILQGYTKSYVLSLNGGRQSRKDLSLWGNSGAIEVGALNAGALNAGALNTGALNVGAKPTSYGGLYGYW